MKNVKKNALILFFITIIVLFFVLKDDFSNIVAELANANIFWIMVAILFIFLNWSSKTNSMFYLTKKYKQDIKWWELFRQVLVTQFFCGITPFSTGGEPMAIYMLKKSGLKIAHAGSVVLQNFIMYQIVLVLYGILAVLLNIKYSLFDTNPLLKQIVILGFIINCLVAIGLFIIGFSKKTSKKILKLFAKIGNKLKLIKDKEKFINKYEKKLEEFHECASLFKKEKVMFLKIFINNFFGMGVLYLIPLILLYSLGCYNNMDIITSLVCTAYVMIVSNFVPIPGASGGIEYGFLQFFGIFVLNPMLSTALIIWRFITYYLGMILGAILLNFNKGSVKE